MVRARFGFGLDELLNDPFVTRGMSALEAIQHELGQVSKVFTPEAFTPEKSSPVPVNVHFEDGKVTVFAEVPGISPDALSVTVHGKVLQIAGNREAPQPSDEVKVLRRERWSGAFKRSIELPYEVESDTVDAVYSNGVLTVTLQRQQSAQPKKVTIKSE